ncbi:hypothetical protein RRG08_034171 [Elysia crispata]|uniref:MACPF domain-containing protein n=1 Tax=Elysia crispata TaxID=231223 RepID=A0AAE0XTB7_9GAST|nr:hypothetical protein RRG08_034171 [Elysia crispata]
MDQSNPHIWRFSLRDLLAIIFLMSINLLVVVSEDVECINTPPGVRQMIRGVDITQLDLIPLQFKSDNGFKSPVIKFTCNEKRMYTAGSARYHLPDQLWHITNLPGGWHRADVHLYKTSSDVRSRMTQEVAGEGLNWRFSFSVSGSYAKFQQTLIGSEKYISDVSSFRSSKRVELKPAEDLGMDTIAERQLNAYVGTSGYQCDPAAYHKFINEFGTHYFSTGTFGGYLRSVYETDTEFFSTHTDEEVKAEARTIFIDGGGAGDSSAVSKQFKALSNEQLLFYGGNADLQSPGNVQSWQSTVDANPWLLSGTVKPISDLIRNDRKRSSMERAVEQHLMKAHLVELRRVLTSLKSKHGDSPEIKSNETVLAFLEDKPIWCVANEEVETAVTSINRLLSQYSTSTITTTEPTKSVENGNGHNVLTGTLLSLCLVGALIYCV